MRVQFWVIAIGWVSSAQGSCVAQKRFTDCLCGYCCAPYVVAKYQEGKEDWAKCIGYSCLRILFGGLCDPLWADPKPKDGGFCAVYGHWSALPGPVSQSPTQLPSHRCPCYSCYYCNLAAAERTKYEFRTLTPSS